MFEMPLRQYASPPPPHTPHPFYKETWALAFVYLRLRKTKDCKSKGAISSNVFSYPRVYVLFFFFFKILFIYFREVKGGKKREREKNINVWLPLMCPLLGI